MKLTGIDHINLDVKDLEKTVGFYHDLFGFEIKEEGISMNGNPWKIIGISGVAYLALYETGIENDYSGLNHLGFNVDNFEEFKNLAAKLKVEIDSEFDYPKSKSAYITDPNGLEIEVSSSFGGGLT